MLQVDGHRPGLGSFQGLILAEDLCVQLLQRLAGVYPELLHQSPSRPVVGRQGFALVAGSVAGEHELSPQSLPPWVCGDERLQLADQIRIAAEGEIGVDALLQRRESQVAQSFNLHLRKRGKGQILKRRPPEQSERFAQGRCGSLRITGRTRPPTLIHQGVESLQITLALTHLQEVSGRARQQPFRCPVALQHLSQPRNIRLNRVGGGRRRRVPPKPINQTITRDDLVVVEEEDRQGRPLFRAAERKHSLTLSDFKRTQNQELHGTP
jgi:hypothetical protein